MISCLLKHITRNLHDLPVSKELAVNGETLDIGRAAACKIHLLHHQVHLHHATIDRTDDGSLYISGAHDLELNINDSFTKGATLTLGMRIEISPYLLIVESLADDNDLTLSLEMIGTSAEQDAAPYRHPISLAELAISKRKLGFGLALFIALLFMLLPLLPSVSPTVDKWQAHLPLSFTDSWNAGKLSDGHSIFGGKCSTCHQRPFKAVSDESCEKCHKLTTKHLAKKELQASAFKHVRCTECHIDHQGNHKLILHDPANCVQCHGNIKHKSVDAQISNVSDFASEHPEFHLTLRDGKHILRIRQDSKTKLAETPHLKYSHFVHLKKDGISSPQGDTVMQCADCHKLEDSGIHFAPMSMKASCQQSGCHALDFSEPAEGSAPHGSASEVISHLRHFYARWLTELPENMASCELPPRPSQQTQRTLDCASELALKNAGATLFRKNLECGECHEIEASGDAETPWRIVPPQINRDWQAGATFPHSKHGTINCTDCHDKLNSKVSADISMPNIAKCRECHSGNLAPPHGKIATDCDSCHRFHLDGK